MNERLVTNARQHHKRMNSSKQRAIRFYKKGKSDADLPGALRIKLFISLGILLIVLLMKRFDFPIGTIHIDQVYDIIYYQEDLESLKNKVLQIGSPAE